MENKDLIAVFGVLLTALIGLYWNFRNAKSARKEPFLRKQLELCHDASLSAARLASLANIDEWLLARQRFWELFWGPLSIVEDIDVKKAMENFGAELRELGDSPTLPAKLLGRHSFRLARAIRVLILKSWSIDDMEKVLDEAIDTRI
jgi:hypothetical protein